MVMIIYNYCKNINIALGLEKLYIVVQNIRGPKLSWLGQHVSIHRKTFAINVHKCQNTLKFMEKHLQFK